MNNDMELPMLKTARDDFGYWLETIDKVKGGSARFSPA